jgi:cardiolipin synthase
MARLISTLGTGGAADVMLVLLLIYWVVVILVLIWEDREPYDTLAWILGLLLLPGLGLILYFMVGRNWPAITQKRPWLKQMLAARRPFMNGVYERYRAQDDELLEQAGMTVVGKVGKAIWKENEAAPLPARTFEIYPSGEEYFPVLIEDLAQAKRFIHMQYFIWERDELTTKICDVLMDRLKAGVEVRILNDWLGNIQYKKDQLKALKEAGAHWGADVSQFNKANYRNHRKITVIDGDVGHTGGVNIGQEYIDGGEKYPAWRDTGIRFTGPAVAGLQRLFAERWWERHDENLFDSKYFPDPDLDPGTIMTQVVSQGVEDHWNSSTRAHQVAITGAGERLLISSPYFVPDYSTRDAMMNAALSGVEVHFMMTGWPDKKLAFDAAKSYWKRQLEAGVHIHLYMKGFFHSKSIVVDDVACAIGTMNMDIRSLRLHKELMVWNYDSASVQRLTDIFFDDLRECREVTLDEVNSWGNWEHFSHSFARLTSNLI